MLDLFHRNFTFAELDWAEQSVGLDSDYPEPSDTPC